MADGRADILGGIRKSLGRGALSESAAAPLIRRMESPERHIIPDRAKGSEADLVERFVSMATEASATVDRIDDVAKAPDAILNYLKGQNLPAQVKMAPDPTLDAAPWADAKLLKIEKGRCLPSDDVSVTAAHAGVAETGTLMLLSGANAPTTLNFLPDTHIVLLWRDQIVGGFEDAWDLARAKGHKAGASMPRTVNMVTGPSRSADIEQTLQLGAHGPRRLHIVLVDAARK